MTYFVHYQLYVVLLISPILIFPSINWLVTIAAYFVVLLLWLNRRYVTGQFSLSTPIDLSLICLLLVLPINLWATVDYLTGLMVISRLCAGVILFYAFVNGLSHKNHLFWILGIIIIGGSLVALLGLFTTDWRENKIAFLSSFYDYLPQASVLPERLAGRTGGLFHPNIIAVTVGMIIPLALGLQVVVQHWWLRWSIWLLIIWMGLILLLTQSRLAMAAVGLAIWGMFVSRYRWGWTVTAGGFVVGVGLIFYFDPVVVQELFLDMFLSTGTGTWQSRREVWQNGLYALSDFPFTGVGLTMFEPVSRLLYPYFQVSPTWKFGHAHNVFLQVGLDFGFGGLIAFLALLGGVIWTGLNTYFKVMEPFQSIVRGLLGSVAVYIGFGLFDCLPFWTKSGFIPWMIFGLIMVCHQVRDETG